MNTNTGMNWVGIFFLAMSAINTMPEGAAKTVLLSICMIASSIVAFATKGSGLSTQDGVEILDAKEDVKEVLKRGRK